MIVVVQFILATMAAYALVRFKMKFSGAIFALILLQLMISPDVLILNNYKTIGAFGLRDTLTGIALPYFASAFAIFLLRQTFKSIPLVLEEAAIVRALVGFISCARFISRWPNRSISLLPWYRLVSTGTISCGLW